MLMCFAAMMDVLQSLSQEQMSDFAAFFAQSSQGRGVLDRIPRELLKEDSLQDIDKSKSNTHASWSVQLSVLSRRYWLLGSNVN